MDIEELDRHMRVFENAHDHCVLPGLYMVARLDGRGFTRLTKQSQLFEKPFDERFRDAMVATARHLMQCGLRVVYGYTQSDEISLVLHRDDTTFGRKIRKLISVLAGEASAVFSLQLGMHAVFDCRISQLPTLDYVVRYLGWRAADAHRNALSAHCYWALRNNGHTAAEADALATGMTAAQKNELLFTQSGLNFNTLPAWQRRGIGLVWQEFERTARNPLTGAEGTTTRRGLFVEMELPMPEHYAAYVGSILQAEHTEN